MPRIGAHAKVLGQSVGKLRVLVVLTFRHVMLLDMGEAVEMASLVFRGEEL